MKKAARLQDQLLRQLRLLQASCHSFDEGQSDEAIRIATAIRVLLRDGAGSTSLLTHLNAKNIQLLSTVPKEKNLDGMIFYDGLTRHGPHGPEPTLDDPMWSGMVPVAEWLEQVVYVVAGQPITRNNLVMTAANKDGGAHVDHKLPPKYETLTNSFLYTTSSDNLDALIPLTNIHLIGLRQLGHEILRSPDIVDLAKKAESAGS